MLLASRRALIGKLFRYSVASLSGTVVGLGTLVLCKAGLGWSGVVSNLVSVTLGTIPNYLINRYWTWQRSGRARMSREVFAFWVLALLGLLVSTGFVAYADHRWGTTLAVAVAQLAGFGLLWVGKYVFLEKVLFRPIEQPAA